ncbi:proto-oncogene c-Fos isoform X1 [Alosa sapidissima]|uniref:proto-oncogene c-Fos isoform X1 n=2 Tax=Alosa sapidissima TaxID=34773 RepID=UPI001C08A185|nr:proto-oncogene c-Fos isoform X1 [Alosa sapidissima]
MFSSNANTDSDSLSRCSSASPAGETLAYYPQSQADALLSTSSASPTETTQMDVSEVPFAPTVTAISTTPDLQWMVQPTIITSVSPSLGRAQTNETQNSVSATPKAGSNKGKHSSRKGKNELLSPEEEEKMRIRRERNKMAAAKCRNRRRELTDTLQAETDKLEEDKATLQAEINSLLKEKKRLEYVLATHRPTCQMLTDLEGVLQESTPSPQNPSSPDTLGKLLSEEGPQEAPVLQELEDPIVPYSAISGNSNILLCATAEDSDLCDLEPSLDIREELLDNLLVSAEERMHVETARSVPDIDLSGPLGLADWETLYKSVASDLEQPLSTPVVSMSTPTCSSYLSVFTFSCPEQDSVPDGAEFCKSDSRVDILNSPTLLAL